MQPEPATREGVRRLWERSAQSWAAELLRVIAYATNVVGDGVDAQYKLDRVKRVAEIAFHYANRAYKLGSRG